VIAATFIMRRRTVVVVTSIIVGLLCILNWPSNLQSSVHEQAEDISKLKNAQENQEQQLAAVHRYGKGLEEKVNRLTDEVARVSWEKGKLEERVTHLMAVSTQLTVATEATRSQPSTTTLGAAVAGTTLGAAVAGTTLGAAVAETTLAAAVAETTGSSQDRLQAFIDTATTQNTSHWHSLALPLSPATEGVGLSNVRGYVISLPHREDRRLRFVTNALPQLQPVGFASLQWWPAVPAMSLPRELLWLNQSHEERFLVKEEWLAQYGCHLSHLSIWRHHAAHHPDSDLFVLEDDARLRGLVFTEHLKRFVTAVPEDWEVLQMCSDAVWEQPVAMHPHYMEGGWMSRTSGYILRASAVSKAILGAEALPVVKAIDQMMSHWFNPGYEVELRGFSPAYQFIGQDTSSISDIKDVLEDRAESPLGKDMAQRTERMKSTVLNILDSGLGAYGGMSEAQFNMTLDYRWFSFCGTEQFGCNQQLECKADNKFCQAARCSAAQAKAHTDVKGQYFEFSCYNVPHGRPIL